jgi:hypothetical protein
MGTKARLGGRRRVGTRRRRRLCGPAVRQLRKELGTSHGTIGRVADQIGCGGVAADLGQAGRHRRWCRAWCASAEAKRIRELEQENRELRRANDLLIVAFVDEHRTEFGVEFICKHLQVAPSTYYAAKKRQIAPSARAVRDALMMQVLLTLWIAPMRKWQLQLSRFADTPQSGSSADCDVRRSRRRTRHETAGR